MAVVGTEVTAGGGEPPWLRLQISHRDKPWLLINPVVTDLSKEQMELWEAALLPNP